jgi:hypothetical protein
MSRPSFRPRPVDIHRRLPIVRFSRELEDDDPTFSLRAAPPLPRYSAPEPAADSEVMRDHIVMIGLKTRCIVASRNGLNFGTCLVFHWLKHGGLVRAAPVLRRFCSEKISDCRHGSAAQVLCSIGPGQGASLRELLEACMLASS